MKYTSILAIVLCLLVSCNRNTIKTNKNCGREPDLVGQTIRFNLMNRSMTSTFSIIQYEEDGVDAESVTSSDTDENMLQFFIKYCADKNIVLKDHVMAFVIYTNSIASENTSVDDDQIKGITVYTVKGNRIMHHLYLRDSNDNFYEEENVRVRVPFITANHIGFYSRNYVFPDNQTHSTIVIDGKLSYKIWKNLDRYWTSIIKYEVNPRPNPKVRTITYKHGDSVSSCKL